MSAIDLFVFVERVVVAVGDAALFVVGMLMMAVLVAAIAIAFIGIPGIYLLIPAYAANMAPIPTAKIFRRWNAPIWERRLGKNKTWFGTVGGFLAAIAVTGIQTELERRFVSFADMRPEEIRQIPWPIMGLILSIGALGGDMFKSTFKRWKKVDPGRPWKPWDDLDFGAGTVFVLLPFLWGNPRAIIAIIFGAFFAFMANPIVNRISYWAGIKAVPH